MPLCLALSPQSYWLISAHFLLQLFDLLNWRGFLLSLGGLDVGALLRRRGDQSVEVRVLSAEGRPNRSTGQGSFARDFGLRDQMQRAAVSVMSNIAEGFDRGSRSEFHQFLVIAKASCAEVRSQLYVAFDIGHIDEPEFDRLRDQTEELSRVIGGLRATVQRKRDGN